MKTILTLLLCAGLALTSRAAEVVRGTTLTDGQQLYASDLHNLVDTATIGPQFYNDQQTVDTLTSGYYFLVLDPVNQVYRRITANSMMYANTNMWWQLTDRYPYGYNYLSFFDPTNGWVGRTTISNLVYQQASNINVSGMRIANSNGFLVSPWPYAAFSGFSTNYPVTLLAWDTNGAPYRQSLSNAEVAIARDFGTNMYVGWQYSNTFQPWSFGYTNTPAFTNAWGLTTSFPITSLLTGSTNAPTLQDADSIPVASGAQRTNTTFTLDALYQYLTNRNTLPPYTYARIQFSGGVTTIAITNDASAASNTIHVAANSFPGAGAPPWCVSGISNGTQVQITGGWVTNTPYYVVPALTNNGWWLKVYPDYPSAAAGTNNIPIINSGSGTLNQLLYVTPFTSYNCDVIPLVTPPSTVRVGAYDVFFRTNAASSLYYISGVSTEAPAVGNSTVLLRSGDKIQTSSHFRMQVSNTASGAGVASSSVHIMVTPE